MWKMMLSKILSFSVKYFAKRNVLIQVYPFERIVMLFQNEKQNSHYPRDKAQQ